VSDRSRLRLIVMQVVVLSLLATLVGRLWYLQVYNGAQYRADANSNELRSVVTPAVRGQILDDMGRPLVTNRTVLVVTVNRSTLDNLTPAQAASALTGLAKLLHTSGELLADQINPCGDPGAKPPPLCWNGSPFQPVPVATGVSEQLALSILERSAQFPGVAVTEQAQRDYPAPFGVNAAHELGYIGPVTGQEVTASSSSADPLNSSDMIGRTGLEAQYDSYLRGVDGVQKLAINQAGDVIGTVSDTPATSGDDLVTNLDARVQATLEAQLVAAVRRARSQVDPTTGTRYLADSAAGVVLNVTNGQVIAMASLPTYDPSWWVGGITQKEYDELVAPSAGQPLISRAYQAGFAPGSTFKVMSSTAMLQAGYSAAGPYDCSSNFVIPGDPTQPFNNDESASFGPISLERAIEVSCDTVFYRVAYAEWVHDGGNTPVAHPRDIFMDAALGWGFGKVTGVDLPGEEAGNITTRASHKATWLANRAQYCAAARTGYPDVAKTNPAFAATLKAYAADNCSPAGALYRGGDAVNFVIGQGDTLITPLKLAQVYAAIANGGTLWTPQVAKAILSPAGKVLRVFTPVAQGHLPVDKTNLAWLQNALQNVTTSGTSQVQFSDFPLSQIPVASKTGTAQVANHQPTSWFATYAPANKPKYAVVMMVTQGGFGSTTSADSVKAIYQALFGVRGMTVNPNLSILPGDTPPTTLPVITAEGTIAAPRPVTKTTALVTHPSPANPSVPTLPAPFALGPPPQVFGAPASRRGRGGGT
jgi:penicillin-binding protein 2